MKHFFFQPLSIDICHIDQGEDTLWVLISNAIARFLLQASNVFLEKSGEKNM